MDLTKQTEQSGNQPQAEANSPNQVTHEDLELSAKRIHQDLVGEQGCAASYWSVRRFVGRLRQKTPLPVRRIETDAGEEAQVDFGSGAAVVDDQGKRRKPWMFRIVLSHSRKGYSEVVWHQTTDNFIAALENAFHHFGGVPKRLVIDNLKAAWPGPTGTTRRCIPSCNRLPRITARRSCPPSRTRRSTRP